MPQTAIVLLGPPGSGKGTQAAKLSSELAIPAISTGEILRRESASGSKLGRLVQRVLASGQLVNDKIMARVVESRLSEADCRSGFILDGYPRTVSQARQLDRLFDKLRFAEPFVFDFQISSGEILGRLSSRLECTVCGKTFNQAQEDGRGGRCDQDGSMLVRRADDNAASIEERLRLYSANAGVLARYYARRQYHAVGVERPAAAICAELVRMVTLSRTQPLQRSVRRAGLARQLRAAV
jgi:adenylate kinase